MLKIIGYILLIGIGLALVKLFFAFMMALFTFTIVAFIGVGPIVLILRIIGVLAPDTAWLVVKCAVGVGLFIDVVKFIKAPDSIFSDTKRIYNTPTDAGGDSDKDTSRDDIDDRFPSDQYRKCCGSCKWFSGHASHYDVCTLHGNEMNHSDYCTDWQT